MTTTLVLPDPIAETLLDFAKFDVETGAVLLARAVRTPGDHLRLLATSLMPVDDDAYDVRAADQLLITSGGYVPALGRAEATGAVAIWLHTHPGNGASPNPSSYDRRVDEQLADVFRIRSGSSFYGATIISQTGGELRFTGHIETESQRLPIDRLLTVGPRLALARNNQTASGAISPMFDRNVRAFGGDVQRVLQDLQIAIVGCGGTGSAVAEQLVRLGVRHFLLVDPDKLSSSNVTRVYGSRAADLDRPKVEMLADHLRAIAPDAVIDCLASTIALEASARRLTDADVVFGCTDDNAGRLVLSRLATYMLTPVIDCGVLLSSNDAGTLTGIDGRVTILHPGAACLVCRNRIDLARAGAELLEPDERTRLADEGYAPALPGVEPAVVAYTTMVAAFAVGELLERLTRYGPEPAPSEILVRIHEREVSTNDCRPRPRHYCHPDSGKWGLGLSDPFLEQTWPE